MVQYIEILRKEKTGNIGEYGTIAVDSVTGAVAAYTNENLIEALSALFRNTTDLFRIKRIGLSVVKEEIKTDKPVAWLGEMRRQLPSPFFGGPMYPTQHSLDNISKINTAPLAEGFVFRRF